MKTTQIQSKPFSRKAKSAAADRKAVKAMDASFAYEMAAIKARQAAAPVAPVSLFPAKKTSSLFAGFGQPVREDDGTVFASNCH